MVEPLYSEDEAEGLVKLDQQEIENDEWGALGDAVTEGGEGVVKATQTARDEAEGNGNEAESEGDDGHQTATECRGKKGACGREEDGMGHEREQGYHDHIDDQKHQ